MLSPRKLIEEINKSCKDMFAESTFYFSSISDYRFIISGNVPSKAINYYHSTPQAVKVIKWFHDFWLYVEINFMKVEIEARLGPGINQEDYLNRLSEGLLKIERDYYETAITLSVFKGDDADEDKSQLFRAEWDNRLDNGTHPQPHWHIYPDLRLIKSFEAFVEITDEGGGFKDMLREEKSKSIDLSRIHFAMNGQWGANGGHFHRISDWNAIKSWFQGLLDHIKSQLEYWKSL